MQELFGVFNNEPVQRIGLRAGGLTAFVLTWGASLQDLRLDGYDKPLVLGFNSLNDYLEQVHYFGASVGRFANRIGYGCFSIDGHPFQLDQNEKNIHHLHGGFKGISQRNWVIEKRGDDFIRLSILDPDGLSGYPGNCKIICHYQLKAPGILRICYESTCDRPTIANITHHSYFNLDGSSHIFDHEVKIKANYYLPISDALIPLGMITPVDNTEFDFQAMRPIRSPRGFMDYDHNFCLSNERTQSRSVAVVRSIKSGIGMEVYTGEPGIQFYAGNSISPSVKGLNGALYHRGAGFCLEPQIWPDAPNHKNFPNAILRPGEVLTQYMEYRFFRQK